jgi:hypothetical protein
MRVEIPDEALEWADEYGLPRDKLQGFAQAVGSAVQQQVVQGMLPVVQETSLAFVHANEFKREFYGKLKDLIPFNQDVGAVAQQYMANPNQHRGRTIEQCADEIANIVRLQRNLPGATMPGGSPAAVPNEGASVEGAQTAPGGSAGGASGTRRPPAPRKKQITAAEDYIQMRGEDHVNRVLGGTRIGRKALEESRQK